MSDLSSYRQQVTQYGQRAQEAENGKRYEEAYGHYMAALDVFMHLIKCKFTCNRATFYSLVDRPFHIYSSREEPTACQAVQGEDGTVPTAC